MSVSLLRLAGMLLGLIALLMAAAMLRRHVDHRSNLWLLILIGLSLIALGAFPPLINLPAELFALADQSGGRIIFLLLFSTVCLWGLILYERHKRHKLNNALELVVRYWTVAGYFRSYPSREPFSGVLVLMPAFNEALNLESVLPTMPQQVVGLPLEVLVINDCSTDATEKTALHLGAKVVSHPFNRGGGAALRTGYEIAKHRGAKIIITMDADGQHDPGDIPTLLEPIINGDADLVVGSRVLGTSDKYSAVRSLGVRVFSRLLSLLMGLSITDCSSGFRAIRSEAIAKLRLEQDQYHTAEMILEACKKRLNITERPITIKRRLSGESKKSNNFVYALGFLRTIIVSYLR